MEADIIKFFDQIKNNTGIDFVIYDACGKTVFGNSANDVTVADIPDGVKSQPENARTLFRLELKNKVYIGKIDGAGKVEYNYATLITELIKTSFSRPTELSREEFLLSLLHSEIGSQELGRYLRKYRLSTGSCCAMIITASSGIAEAKEIVENYGSLSKDFCVTLDKNSCVFVKFSDDATKEYCSFTEYAEYIAQSVFDELGVRVKVYIGGIVKSIAELGTSFMQASTTLRMSEAENSKAQIHSFKEYMLIKILEDIPKYKLDEYLKLLTDPGAEEIFSDEEMMQTAEEFLLNSLNQSETARTLYLHRNTLSYRLDKIEKATGLNIRNFSDAVSFRLITVLHKLVK